MGFFIELTTIILFEEKQQMKEFLIVSMGSFLGGGMRFLVSKLMTMLVTTPFPLGTFTVNILGCLLIGFFSALPGSSSASALSISTSTRLLLTTGFCGGFTTFSTLMKESDAMMTSHHPFALVAYLTLSFSVGMVAVWIGQRIASCLGG